MKTKKASGKNIPNNGKGILGDIGKFVVSKLKKPISTTGQIL
jgi:hypothetical protein